MTRPTGFDLLPPVGPAIPLTEIAQLTLNFIWTPLAIDSTTCFDTAPWVLIIFSGTPSNLCLIELLYAMTPPWKIFEDPGIFVSLEPIPPPVHDSATAIVSFLFSNNLNIISSRVSLSTH